MADGYIVDTSVFLRWFIDQVGYAHARQVLRDFLAERVRLETIDFARVELSEILRKKGLLERRIDRSQYVAGTRLIDELQVTVHQIDVERLARAADLAAEHSLRVFDALFVELARERRLTLLTADRKLCSAVSRVARAELLQGIEPTVDPG